jgi:tetratricopeptide (TPR) repeat protein
MTAQISRWFVTLVAVAVALLQGPVLLAQAPSQTPQPRPRPKPQVVQPQEPEPEYTEEEYDAYEKATQEKDLDKQGALLLAFMEKWPKSKLQPYIVTAYQTMLYQLHKTETFAKLLPASEAWLKYFPTDLPTINYAAGAAAKLNQDAKFLEYGLKVYAAKPTDDYAYFIAQTYKKMGNEPKYQEWIEKTLVYPKYANNLAIRYEFVDKYVKEKNLAKASDAAQSTLKAAETAVKPEGTAEATWKSDVSKIKRSCHYVIGVHLYEKEKYPEAMKELEKTLALDPGFDMGYYYIGLSQWKLGKVENDEAPLAFAKAYLLKGEIAEQAKQHLEKIYKALHNDTLVNVQKIYDRAKEELRNQRSSN